MGKRKFDITDNRIEILRSTPLTLKYITDIDT